MLTTGACLSRRRVFGYTPTWQQVDLADSPGVPSTFDMHVPTMAIKYDMIA